MIDTKELRRLAQAANAEPDGDVMAWIEGMQRLQWALLPDDVIALLDRLEVAEKSDAESVAMYRKARDERDAYKTAFEEWHQKTGWVQQGINDGSIPPTYLGRHRADVMTDMLKSARRDYCVLEGYYTELAEKLEAAEKAVTEAYQRGYATGQEEIAAELEFAKQEIANLHDDISEWMDKCDTLRTELETERMRLAACGVVALANTPDSAKRARDMRPEYWSASCGDVARMVDENIKLRAKIEAMERQRPVRFVFKSDELDEQIKRATDPAWAETFEVPEGMAPLYALPGAKGE